jgi:uncharacterized protein (DUF433 family)
MNLPDFLRRDPSGYIQFTGHRIGLHHVMRLYKQGYTAEKLAEEYPTLPLTLIREAIAFYLENRAEVDAYLAEEEAEYQRQVAAHPPSPALLEIRRRMAAKGFQVPE